VGEDLAGSGEFLLPAATESLSSVLASDPGGRSRIKQQWSQAPFLSPHPGVAGGGLHPLNPIRPDTAPG